MLLLRKPLGDGCFVRQRLMASFLLAILTLSSDMNLPLTGIAFGLVWIFLRVRTPEGSIKGKLARVDWL